MAAPTTISQSVQYNGYSLPADARQPVIPMPDNSNNPKLVIIGGTAGAQPVNLSAALVAVISSITGTPGKTQGVILPFDVTFSTDYEKVIAEAGILDAPSGSNNVEVTEHIRRKPCELEFNFTLRAFDSNGGNMYPQSDLKNLLNLVFMPNGVQPIQNTDLNGRGITQIIIKRIHIMNARGTTNVPVRMIAKENVPGPSLNITKTA